MDYISCSNHNGDTQKCIIVNMSPRIRVRYRVHICIQVHIPSSDYLCGLSRLPRKKSKPNPFSIKIIGLIPFKNIQIFFYFSKFFGPNSFLYSFSPLKSSFFYPPYYFAKGLFISFILVPPQPRPNSGLS